MNGVDYVIGIGASAGGLEAIKRILDSLPLKDNIAIVIIQHLSPDFKSVMKNLLATHTNMEVKVAIDEEILQPGTIYLNSPMINLEMDENRLIAKKIRDKTSLNLPIDIFFRSLGSAFKERSIGVILSGTGSDGSKGIATIKEEGGTVIVQAPQSAQFDGMPRSAISKNIADFILAPEDISNYLTKFCTKSKQTSRNLSNGQEQYYFLEILGEIEEHSGINFYNYKKNTLIRRSERRMQVLGIETFSKYLIKIKEDEEERDILLQSFLIGVTQFFRDSDAFDIVREEIIPQLINAESYDGHNLRIWVPGCSTGEEAVTIALLLDEYITRNELEIKYKIYATDIDASALKVASNGIYDINSAAEIPTRYLQKYFIGSDNRIELKHFIRKRIVFSHHNILKDPPFIRTDFISCRNLLIYIDQKVQHVVLQNFTYSLADNSVLMLGPSEHIGKQGENYSIISSKWNVYKKKANLKIIPARIEPSYLAYSPIKDNDKSTPKKAMAYPNVERTQVSESTFHWYLSTKYAPSSIFVDGDFKILFIQGDAGKRIMHSEGLFENNFLKLITSKLARFIRKAITKIQEGESAVLIKNIQLTDKPDSDFYNVTVCRPKEVVLLNKTYQIVFDYLVEPINALPETVLEANIKLAENTHIEELEDELRLVKAQLQKAVAELELSNEELQSSNEELTSSNEELQATNEELQSLNEELHVVNSEYQDKNKQLLQLNDDINNLLENIDIGTLYLDNELNIRKFTSPLNKLFDLRQVDIGRPILGFTSNFEHDFHQSIHNDAKNALNALKTFQSEIIDKDGNTYLKRVSPFVTEHRKVDGVVITFIDISELKDKEEKLQVLETRYKTLFENLNEGFALAKVLTNAQGDPIDWEYITINPAFERQMGLTQEQLIGKRITQVFPNIVEDDVNWIQKYGQIALNGEEEYIDYYAPTTQKHFIIHVFSPNKGEFATTFTEITHLKKIEEDLTKKTFELGKAQEIANMGSWYLDLATNKVTWTKELYNMYGFDPSLPPPPFEEHAKLFTKESWDKVAKAIEKATNEGLAYELELEMLRKDNTHGWLKIKGEAIAEKNGGKIIALRGVAHDITKSRELLSKIKFEQEFSKKITDVSPCGMYIYDFELKTNTFMNQHYTALLGYSKDEINGLTGAEFQRLFHPEDGQKIREHMASIIDGQTNVSIEYRFRHKDGHWVWCYSFDSPFEYFEDGTVKSFIGTFIDVSEQKETQMELTETREFYSNMLQYAPDGVILFDTTENVSFLAGAGLKVLNLPTESKSLKLSDIVFKPNYNSVSKRFKGLLKSKSGKKVIREEFRIKSKTETWIEGSFSIGKDLSGEKSIVLNFRDITGRKSAEKELNLAMEKLKVSNKDLEQFAYIASHDLQEPLNSMNSLIGLLTSQYNDKLDDMGRQSLKYIQTSGDRMSNLIKGLLEHSKIGRTPKQDKIDCNELMAEIIVDLNNVISETGSQIEVGKLPVINGFKTELRLLFQNLLTNAIKFRRQETTPIIKINAHLDDDWVFSVEDNGIGIKDEYKNRIFVIFQRLHAKEEYEGTGIGLAHVKKIVDLHGGSIDVESDGQTGTKFIIKLPN